MVKRISLRRSGGSITATIPKEMADRYNLVAGEDAFAVETDQGMLITAYDPNFERAMTVYQNGAKRFKNAMRDLSK